MKTDTLILLTLVGITTASLEGIRPLSSKAYQATISETNLLNRAEKLFEFAQQNGNTRSFGSPGHNATVDYIKSVLDRTGFYDTYLQTFSWLSSEGTSDFSANGVEYESAWFTYAPAGDINASLVLVNDLGCNQEDFPASVAGKIALIKRGTCSFGDKVARAGAAGAAGVLIYNNASGPIGGGTLSSPDNPIGPYVPATSLSGVDGEALVSAVQGGQEVVGTLHVEATNEERWTSNVIATTKSGDKDNIVMAGGHTDSVPAGPGINDDGSGSLSILELAVQLSRFRFKNAVRFGFWTAEEVGLVGSDHYVASLSEEETAKIALYLNFDMVASPNFGYFIYDGDGSAFNLTGPPGSDHIEKTFEDYFKKAKLVSAPTAFNGRSDYGPFLDAGIPAGGLFTGAEGIKTPAEAEWWGGEAGVAYDACYHSACDTVENLNLPAWVQNTKAAGHAIATYATSLKGIPRDAKRTLALSMTLRAPPRHQACGHEFVSV